MESVNYSGLLTSCPPPPWAPASCPQWCPVCCSSPSQWFPPWCSDRGCLSWDSGLLVEKSNGICFI